jgi:hypothetical protein
VKPGARAPVAGMHSVGIQSLDFEGVGGVTENLDAARLVVSTQMVASVSPTWPSSDPTPRAHAIMPEMR